MKNKLLPYFSFSKTEFNGVMVLLLLIGFSFFAATIFDWFFPAKNIPNAAFQQLNWQIQNDENAYHNYSNYTKKPYKNTIKSTHFYEFNPNTANVSDWENFGLSPKQAQTIIHYLEKGGKFRKKEDLKKMFVISAELYPKLENYISIPDEGNKYVSNYPAAKEKYVAKEVIVEINTADTSELVKIKGIGTVFANRIVKYRNRIGGFYTKEQLKEVYGLNEEKYNEIAAHITVNADKIQKVAINSADFKVLRRFSPLSNAQINAIINYKNQHGPYKSSKDLEKIVILPAETIQKISPYLTYD